MPGPIDLFIVAGQSNAEGRGTSGPTVTGASLEYTGSTLVALEDPVGGADTGSAWPTFANYYEDTTGVPVCISESAKSGAALLLAAEGGSGNWSTSGALFAAAVTKAQNALAALTAAEWTPTLRGVIWSQGEREGVAIGDSDLKSQYETALTELLTRFEASLGRSLVLFVVQTGRPDSGDTIRFARVRAGQAGACAVATDRKILAHSDAVNFPDDSKMSDEYHYNQTALNEIGTAVATVAVNKCRYGVFIGAGVGTINLGAEPAWIEAAS